MAAFSDLILRTDVILKKYEHYDETSGTKKKRRKTDDIFTDKYFDIMDRVQEINLKAESIAAEKNRAMKAAFNAEIRKEKAALQEDVEDLSKIIVKKGISPEEEEERVQRFEEVKQAVSDIDDGTGSAVKKPQRDLSISSSMSRKGGSITLNGGASMQGSLTYEGAYEHTEETREFVRDATMAMERQDMQLENIERGVDTLKEIGEAMGEEIERHDVVIDEVGAKMDVVTRELQTNDMKLKGVLTQVRSSRKIFIDIILVCILLAVGLYIYSMFK